MTRWKYLLLVAGAIGSFLLGTIGGGEDPNVEPIESLHATQSPEWSLLALRDGIIGTWITLQTLITNQDMTEGWINFFIWKIICYPMRDTNKPDTESDMNSSFKSPRVLAWLMSRETLMTRVSGSLSSWDSSLIRIMVDECRVELATQERHHLWFNRLCWSRSKQMDSSHSRASADHPQETILIQKATSNDSETQNPIKSPLLSLDFLFFYFELFRYFFFGLFFISFSFQKIIVFLWLVCVC